MFTGIVDEVGKITLARPAKLVIAAKNVLNGMVVGASLGVNGVCLTITELANSSCSVDIMPETVKRTTLGKLKTGDEVNLERPLALSGQLGGHLVQGHVDGTGIVKSIRQLGSATLITFETSPEVMRYIVEKGFIAVDGISLTVVAADARSFQVSIVEHTRKHTTLGSRQVGDLVNLEVDIIAKYVEKLLQGRHPGITAAFLEKYEFLTG